MLFICQCVVFMCYRLIRLPSCSKSTSNFVSMIRDKVEEPEASYEEGVVPSTVVAVTPSRKCKRPDIIGGKGLASETTGVSVKREEVKN